jgi:alanyl aminopeptidase
MLLEKPTGTLPLVSGSCPDWVLANEGELGYYRALYRGDLLTRLLASSDRLTIVERVGLLRDAAALAESGTLPIGQAFDLAMRFANDPSRHVVLSTVRLASVGKPLVPSDFRPAYARFVSRMLSSKARALGFVPKPGEDDDTHLLRAGLVRFTAVEGEDRELQTQAKDLALRWLADRTAVDAEVVEDVLTVAAENGDRELFERFHEALKKSTERRDRRRLLRALGSFRDPAIVRDALAILLTDELDPREAGELTFAPRERESSRRILWEFLKNNFDALVTKAPEEALAFMPFLASGFCDESDRKDVESFFRERVQKLPGSAHNLAQVLERISLCAALKSAQGPGIRAFLEKY